MRLRHHFSIEQATAIHLKSSRTHRSKFHDRAPRARASSGDRHLHFRAAPQKQSSPILTSKPLQLPPVSAAMLSVAREKQISRRPAVRDRSRNLGRRNSAADRKFPESPLNSASASKPTRSKRRTPVLRARSRISFSPWLD